MAGRPRGSTNLKNPKDSEPKLTKQCSMCGEILPLTSFYMSESPLHSHDNKIPYCKTCLKKMFNENGNTEESLKNVLKRIDKPFFYHLYESAKLNSPDNIFGEFMRLIIMPQYRGRGFTWDNSVFTTPDNEKKTSENAIRDEPTRLLPSQNDIERLKDKYGFGYPDEEYMLFEKKYSELKTSFQLLTTMHIEYFKEYCINRVKETLAKAKGDFKQAKEWATMVKDVAEAGKLKPSQMSKADLSGGLDTFGQLARMVEENYEVMPLLPQFIEQPKDKVDVTLWCFINYVRDLKGLPECEYKEIYEFYNRKKQDYENQISDRDLTIEEDDSDE